MNDQNTVLVSVGDLGCDSAPAVPEVSKGLSNSGFLRSSSLSHKNEN